MGCYDQIGTRVTKISKIQQGKNDELDLELRGDCLRKNGVGKWSWRWCEERKKVEEREWNFTFMSWEQGELKKEATRWVKAERSREFSVGL